MTINILSLVATIAIIIARIINITKHTKDENQKAYNRNSNAINNFVNSNYKIIISIFFVLIFITRIYEFGKIPTYIQVDEAGAAYDAYCLAEYGVDRYLNSFPLYLINFGGGQSVLYAYATIPFIKLIGANIIAYRMPELLFFLMGILVSYILVNKIKDKKTALLYTFLIIICPWNIEASRKGLDCNLLAPMFMLDLLLLLTAKKNYHYIISGIAIGITLYTYCLSWILIPTFLLIYVIYMLWTKKINFKQIVLLGIPIAILATPLIYLILLNKGYVTKTNFGIFTIPKLFFFRQGEISIQNLWENGLYSLKTIFGDPYGIYITELPFLVLGIIIGIKKFIKSVREKEFDFTGFITIVFLILLICNLLVKIETINRANILYLPMLYLIAIGISYIVKGSKIALVSILIVLSILFINFEISYFDLNTENNRWESYLYSDNEIGQITANIENNEEFKEIDKYFIITNRVQQYIYTMIATKPSPYDLKFITKQKIGEYGNYHFMYNKITIPKDNAIIVITKSEKYAIQYLEENDFYKLEETSTYCVLKNF